MPVLRTVVMWEADRSHKEAKLFHQLRDLGLPGVEITAGRRQQQRRIHETHPRPEQARPPAHKAVTTTPNVKEGSSPENYEYEGDGIRVSIPEAEEVEEEAPDAPSRKTDAV